MLNLAQLVSKSTRNVVSPSSGKNTRECKYLLSATVGLTSTGTVAGMETPVVAADHPSALGDRDVGDT